MNSDLSTLTERPMPPAARSRLGRRDSASAGVSARSATSLALSAFVQGYLLVLAFVKVKPVSFIDVRRT